MEETTKVLGQSGGGEGTIFDFGNLNPGAWFDVPGGGSICMRVCAGADLRDIMKKTRKKRVEYKQGGRFVIEDVDDELENELIWDFCIVDWKNFFDAKKTPIPCNQANKKLLMGRSVQFASFVRKCVDILTEHEQEVKEAETKNS